ncbi:hypothetical protein [Luteimonas changyuni]|uniref:hypothetical protein n=1 Tax=Luteimonas sp. MJ145 TaxID=3129234 RepID=UPI0031BB790D
MTMRPDQLERLALLSDQLFEVVMEDCKPTNWIGAGRKPKELSPQERGDATWCRKQAAASIGLLLRVEQLRDGPGPSGPPDFDVEAARQKMIEDAERKAADMIARLGAR